MDFVPSKQFVLLGGLPRSGSTLLCNILAQNPLIHSTASSACLDVLFGVRNQWDLLIEHRANPDREGDRATRLRVMRGILEAYHARTPRPVVVDKSRGWIAQLEMAEDILGRKAKVLVPVRNVADVLSSFEKLHRRQSAGRQTPGEAENYHQFQTIAGRCEFWMRADQPVGLALNRIYDVVARGLLDRLHFVQFSELTCSPRTAIDKVYKFLGLDPFDHDFTHVEQVTREDDVLHGFEGLHTIRPRVEPVVSDWRQILGATGERYAGLGARWGG